MGVDQIAARHGVICPYGPHNPAEWNHCQPTWVKVILAESPLRETVTAEGPISLESMFEVGYSLIADLGSLGAPIADPPRIFSSSGKRGQRGPSRGGALPRPQVYGLG